MGYGTLGHLNLGKETTWAASVNPDYSIELMNETLTLARDRFEVKNIIGRLTEPDDVPGLRRIEGDMTTWGHPETIGHFLNAALGQGSKTITVVLSGSLWTLAWMPSPSDASSQNPLVSYTAEVFRDVTSSDRYQGGVLNRLVLAGQPNQDLRVTAGWIFKATSSIAKAVPSFPTSPAFPFTWDTFSLSVGGAAMDLVEALTVTYDNQLEGVPALNNSDEIARIRRRGPVLVRVAGTIEFLNRTEYTNFVNQTEQRFVYSLFRANSFQIVVDLPRVVYTAFPLGQAGRERNLVSFEGKALHHTGSGSPIKVSLTTVRSNY